MKWRRKMQFKVFFQKIVASVTYFYSENFVLGKRFIKKYLRFEKKNVTIDCKQKMRVHKRQRNKSDERMFTELDST